MGVQNIKQNPDEDAQSSDSLLGNGPFFDAADPPVIVDNLSSESDEDEGRGRTALVHMIRPTIEPEEEELLIPHERAFLNPPEFFGWGYRMFDPRNNPYHPWSPLFRRNRRVRWDNRTNVIRSPAISSTVNEAVASEEVVNEEVVNEDKPSHQTKNIPTKSRRAHIGKKKARRIENARRLDILAGGGYYPYDDSEFLSINCPFKFTKVLKNHRLADEVLDATLNDLDEDYFLKDLTKPAERKSEMSKLKIGARRKSPHHAFDNLDPPQKSFITRRHLPRGMIEYLDACVYSFFEDEPTGTYISSPLTSFERMMLHCVAQYYGLNSHSFEHCDERLTKVTNPLDKFEPPPVCFSAYIEKELWKKLETDSGSKRCRSRRQRC